MFPLGALIRTALGGAQNMKIRLLVLALALVFLVVGVQLPGVDGPIGTDASAAEKNVPKNHTVDKDGALHAPGLDTPDKKCAVCHGDDLKGGKKAGSCFECHEKNW